MKAASKKPAIVSSTLRIASDSRACFSMFGKTSSKFRRMTLNRRGLIHLITGANFLPHVRDVSMEIGLNSSHATPTNIHHPQVLGCSGTESSSIGFLTMDKVHQESTSQVFTCLYGSFIPKTLGTALQEDSQVFKRILGTRDLSRF